MRIRSLTACEITVRLRKPIRHAAHFRSENQTLIVRCELDDGSVGWGEGLPRTYVTGESMSSVWRHLEQSDFSVLADTCYLQPAAAVRALEEVCLADVPADPGVTIREAFGNSVRCALELALLDAVCRALNCSIGDALRTWSDAAPVAERQDQVRYSGVITSESPRRQWISALKMRLYGFRQVKVKVGTEGVSDADCLRRVRRVIGSAADLRLDANEAWCCEQVAARMAPLMEYGPTCLEQPVPHNEVPGLAHVRRELGVPIMLDESLCSAEDGRRAIAGGWCDLFNIRLSKCGGLIPSVRLAVLAQQHGLGWQLGCQVGETGILSAAGRHFACNVGQIRYLEGSFDRFLVRDALTVQDLTFGYGGRAKRLTGAGLGVTVDESRVRRKTVRSAILI